MTQMRRLSHISNLFTTEPALALARRHARARDRSTFASVFFGNSGTEANEAALKYARLHALRTKGPGHDRLLCFSGAFHGRTLGALSCTPTRQVPGPVPAARARGRGRALQRRAGARDARSRTSSPASSSR